MLHENAVVGDIHYIQNWSVADNTARDALSVAAADVGKVCQVTGTSSYYLLTDDSPMTWFDLTSTAGVGDVVGPASATDNAIVRFDLTTGKLIQDSGITIADGATGTLSGTNSGDVTLNASVADILGLSTQELTADDPGADRIVFWDDSAAKLTHLTVGTNLTITDTTISASGGGLTLGTPVALTNQTEVDFAIGAGVKCVVIDYFGLSSNGTANLYVQLGDSGGIENTGYASTRVAGTTLSAATAAFDMAGLAASDVHNGRLTLRLIDSSTNTWSGEGTDLRNTTTALYIVKGYKALTGELTTVRLTTANGTDQLDAGTVNIQYQS